MGKCGQTEGGCRDGPHSAVGPFQTQHRTVCELSNVHCFKVPVGVKSAESRRGLALSLGGFMRRTYCCMMIDEEKREGRQNF